MTTLFRKSPVPSRRTLAAFLSRGPFVVPPSVARHQTPSPPSPSSSSSSCSSSVVLSPDSPLSRVLGCRWLHYSLGPCRFRLTEALWTPQHAVDDYSYEEKVQGKGARADEGLEIATLGIAEEIVKKLAQKGITRLFPIQRSVLEPAMEGHDMIGRAKTGTGKTLAFGIPIMDKIIKYNTKHGRGRNPLTLVLAPTRELARQVEKEFKESSDLDTLCVYGGSNIMQQMSALDYGVDVVVGTPGRVIDLIKRGALNLSEVQFLVLDEADQMLAVGFVDDVEVILEKLPKKRQSMLFSATMPNWIRQLARKYLNDPLTIDLVSDSDQKLAEGISLYSIASDNYGKASIIGPLVTEHAKGGKCIVFTQTKRDADRLAYTLARTLRCEPLHGDISQLKRERTLSAFRDGRFNVLVATDVAARGLDIPNVDLIIHFDLPNSSEIFVHRSGRTGRAGKKGSAILIYNEYQTRDVRTIEQHVGSKFEELPKITVEGGAGLDLFGDSSSGRFGSGRSRGGYSAGRSGGFGGSFGRSGDSGSGRSGSRRTDGFGGSEFGGSRGFDRSEGFGNSGKSVGFGSSGRAGGFGSSGRSGGFSEMGGHSGTKRSAGFGGSKRGGSLFDDSIHSGGSRGSGNFGGLGDVGRSRGGFGFGGGSGHSGGMRSGGFGGKGGSGGFDDSD